MSAPEGRGADETLADAGLTMTRMSGWMRRLIWIDLIAALFLPVGLATPESGPLGWLAGLACWVIKVAFLLFGLTVMEAIGGRINRRRLPGFLGVAALLALLAIIMVLASTGIA